MTHRLSLLIVASVGLSTFGLLSAARADIAPPIRLPPPTKAQRASVYAPLAVHFARTPGKHRGFSTGSELHIPRAVLVDLLRGRKDGDARRRRPRVTRGAVVAMAGRVKVTRASGETIVHVSPAQMAVACKAVKKRKGGVEVLPKRAKRNAFMILVRVRPNKPVSVDIPLSVVKWLAKRGGVKAGPKGRHKRRGQRKRAALTPISDLGGGPGGPGWPRALGVIGLLVLIALGATLTLRRRRPAGLGLVVLALVGLAVLTARVSEGGALYGQTDIRITDAKDRTVRLYARPSSICEKGG
jgi:hypothetical protein